MRRSAWCGGLALALAACAVSSGDPRPNTAPVIGTSPQSIRHVYGFDQVPETGSGEVVGIVVAYKDPDLTYEVAQFDKRMARTPIYGIPSSSPCSLRRGPHPCLEIAALGTQTG